MRLNLLLSAITLLLLSNCTSPHLQIVKNGESDYQIAIPAGNDTSLTFAARELQQYLETMTGKVLRIKVSESTPVGRLIALGWPVQNEDMNSNTVSVFASDETLHITGGSSQSTLNAVYTFLEKYAGVRFFSPSVERIPKTTTFEVPADINYTYSPPIVTRTVHSRLFYEHPEFARKQKVTSDAFPGYVPEARVHTFHRFVPEGKYYKQHPEYYALRNGKRLPTQLCLSNPDVYKIVEKAVATLLQQYPDAEVISVSQDDNTQYCQCPQCSAVDEAEGSPAGSVIKFVNQIARAFPDKQISTLAYQYTRKAPAHIIPEKNVLITLCSIECDRSGPIAEKCTDFAHDLEEWGKITGNIRIWDYTTQFTNFLAPFPNLHTLQPNIQLFRDNHAQWVFEQHSNNPSELFELRSYLTAKLLWEPDANKDSIVDDFLTGFYHEAAPFIKDYITTVHDELKKDKDFFLFLYGDPSQAFDSYLKPRLLLQYRNWYDEALQAVAAQPEIAERVKVATLSIDFAMLEAARRQALPALALTLENESGKKEILPATANRLENFAQTCRNNNITLLNEMGFGIDEYVEQYRETLERASLPNLAAGKPVKLLTQPKKYAGEDPLALTDNAFGGLNFYANWLGFEGNHLEAVIDLEGSMPVSTISSAFLQVTNHLVFFPIEVRYEVSTDGKNFKPFGRIKNRYPLTRQSKVNHIQQFTSESSSPVEARYVKIKGINQLSPPVWHHGAGLPAWIFVDEVRVE